MDAVIVPLSYVRHQTLVKPWVSRYPVSPPRDSFWKEVVIELH